MRRTICYALLCAVAVCSVFSDTSYAEEHKHTGFFLRLAPGIGATSSSENYGGDKFEYSGTSGLFNFGIGGAVADNLILHLDISAASMADPKLKVNGQTASSSPDDYTTTLLGVGVTYYLPSNIYVTGAVGTARTELKANGNTYRSDKGYGFNVMLGKEWMVSENWGLGVAGQFLYTSCPDQPYAGSSPDINTSSIGVMFSATYN